MNFYFIPYQLGRHKDTFVERLFYMDTQKGVDLYRVFNTSFKLPGVAIASTMLCFQDGKLISVYMYLSESTGNIHLAVRTLQEIIQETAGITHYTNGTLYYWATDREFLGLVGSELQSNPYLYFSLRAYNLFESDIK